MNLYIYCLFIFQIWAAIHVKKRCGFSLKPLLFWMYDCCPDAVRSVWWEFDRVEAWLQQLFLCLSGFLCHSPGHCLTPALPLTLFPFYHSQPNICSTTFSPPVGVLFSYSPPYFLISCFFLLYCLPSPLLCSLSPLSAVEWWCAVVSPLRGIISVVWERSNLTCPVRLKEGCVRSDLSHTARILPSHETSGLPSPSRPPPSPPPPPLTIINQMKMFTPWFSSL